MQEYVQKGYTLEVAKDTINKAHHCNNTTVKPFYVVDEYEYTTCPCNFKNPLFNYLLVCSDSMEKGILPFAGSLSEQPAKVMEALTLLDNLKLEFKLEQQAKAQKSQGNK